MIVKWDLKTEITLDDGRTIRLSWKELDYLEKAIDKVRLHQDTGDVQGSEEIKED